MPGKKVGAPSIYTQELADKICEYIAQGKSLRTIQKLAGMPSMGCIMKWTNTIPEFDELYARAKAKQTESFNEQIHMIADDKTIPVERAKLMIETRKWIMGKMKPRKYGDKTQIDHAGTITLASLIEGSYQVVEDSKTKLIEGSKDD